MTATAAWSTEEVVLALSGISKRFGHVAALEDVSLQVRRGSVHALVGENGAGKTTLMRIAFGLVKPDAGTLAVGGTIQRMDSPTDAISAGLGMVHQHFTNVPAMTVAENVALGGTGSFDAGRAVERVVEIGQRTGLVLDPHARADDLPVAAQQRLEIVKALVRDARLLILDEPTAVLAPPEAAELLQWLRRFADAGNAVVLITHKLAEALAIADDVTVLRRGRAVLTAEAPSLTVHTLATALLGEEPSGTSTARGAGAIGDVVASLDRAELIDSRGTTVLRDVGLAIRSGEIVGIAGVEGAGHRELLRVLAKRMRVARGVAQLPPIVGFVPEDRQRDALVLDFSLDENVALNGAGARRGRLPWKRLRARTRELVEQFDIRGGEEARAARELSGGNQQKLVLARELDGSPRLLVVENPTRGLDIRATQAIHARLRAVAAEGAGVVVYSSDLDEVLALATRIFVAHGTQLRETARDRDEVGRAMLGVA